MSVKLTTYFLDLYALKYSPAEGKCVPRTPEPQGERACNRTKSFPWLWREIWCGTRPHGQSKCKASSLLPFTTPCCRHFTCSHAPPHPSLPPPPLLATRKYMVTRLYSSCLMHLSKSHCTKWNYISKLNLFILKYFALLIVPVNWEIACFSLGTELNYTRTNHLYTGTVLSILGLLSL